MSRVTNLSERTLLLFFIISISVIGILSFQSGTYYQTYKQSLILPIENNTGIYLERIEVQNETISILNETISTLEVKIIDYEREPMNQTIYEEEILYLREVIANQTSYYIGKFHDLNDLIVNELDKAECETIKATIASIRADIAQMMVDLAVGR